MDIQEQFCEVVVIVLLKSNQIFFY